MDEPIRRQVAWLAYQKIPYLLAQVSTGPRLFLLSCLESRTAHFEAEPILVAVEVCSALEVAVVELLAKAQQSFENL